jgi:hypothetical protein
MSDKRKPSLILLLRFQGKRTHKIELFNQHLFKGYEKNYRSNLYRIRVAGKWFPPNLPKGEMKFFNKWKFRDILFKSIGRF